MEMLIVSFIIVTASMLTLAAAQAVRKAPLPVGCTPENGECCRRQKSGGPCRRVTRQPDPLET